jgi:Protein of unknown function (DUF3606)
MSDKVKDRSRINVSEAAEVTYWCQKLACSETQLRTAVKVVGVAVSRVRAHLNQRR